MRTLVTTLFVAASLLLGLGPGTAVAGAWPRPKGETFVSLAARYSTGARTLISALQDIQSYNSIYAEYGLTEKLTIGLDAGWGAGPGQSVTGALVFGRIPVWAPGEQKVAVDLGFGYLDATDTGQELRIRPGLSWGRGFESRWGGGWLGMESSVEFRTPSGNTAVKVDFTAGLKPTERWMTILQVQTGAYPDAVPLARLAPSVVRKLGPHSHLQVGAQLPLYGDNAYGVMLGMWFTF